MNPDDLIHASPMVRNIVKGILLGLLAILLACVKREPIISMDDWWNVDFVKNTCQLRATADTPCIGDPVVELREFEEQINTFFASDSACRGVILTGFDGPASASSKTASEVDSKADWQLMLDFRMGESSQDWTMVPRSDSGHKRTQAYLTGQGTAKDIIHTICSAVKH